MSYYEKLQSQSDKLRAPQRPAYCPDDLAWSRMEPVRYAEWAIAAVLEPLREQNAREAALHDASQTAIRSVVDQAA